MYGDGPASPGHVIFKCAGIAKFLDRLIKNLTFRENLPFFGTGSDIPAIEKTADPWELDSVKRGDEISWDR
jgi:hypothetical protein